MEPRIAAQIQAEETYSDFIAWSKTAFYWILAVLIILAFFNFGAWWSLGGRLGLDWESVGG